MLTLTFHGNTLVPIEAECITPDQLSDKSPLEVAKLLVQHGNAEAPLGDFFKVVGTATDGDIRIEGDCSRVKWIGAGMTTGRITIQGAIGMHLGAEMRGGEIRVHGNASDWVGAEMRGGRIHIHGDAGHLVGAAYRGARFGMRGGAILVDGKAGNEIGSVMRRGLIAVGGDIGDFPGVSMIAGTILVFGQPGIRPGAGMKRGTLGFFGPKPALLPTFRFDCIYRPVFLALYLKHLRNGKFSAAQAVNDICVARYSGDLVSLGKGEVFCVQPG